MKKLLIFVLIVVVFIALISLLLSLFHKVPIGEKKVALVRVEGVILDSREVIEEIKEYSKDSSVKAVVLRVNSPGGGVAPAQEIYDEIIKLKKSKKVVVSMGAVAASGGYYISGPADRIVANPGTITGSIGVIMELPNIKGLMEKIGVKTQVVKSGKHKDIASAFRNMTEEERKILKNLLRDVHEQFIRAVSVSRGMEYEKVKKISDGRIFTGEKAKDLGLVDELGNLEYAIKLAGRLGGIEGEPRVVSKKERLSLWDIFLDGDLAKEIIQDRVQPISIKYMFMP
jgi:protease-4